MKAHNPPGVHAPFSNYSHGVEAPPGARWLHVSGQVGVDVDGTSPETFDAQAGLVFRNLSAVLDSAGMGPEDLVKVTVFLTRAAEIPALRVARSRFQGSATPASTLVVVQSLARPEWLIEVEAIAARIEAA